jgi:GNAT superfamily N-acetyltransferase
VLIRETTAADIEQLDLVRQAIEPWHVATVETQLRWFHSVNPAAKPMRLCVEVDGLVVANGSARLDLYAATNAGTAVVGLNVHPRVRRQGIGGALLARLEEHLRSIGAVQAFGQLMEAPHEMAFAGRHGYTLGATDRWIVVDPRVLPPMPETPAGVTVATAAETGPEIWYAVVDVAARDEPRDEPFTGMPYDDWLRLQWPVLDKEVSLIAFVDGEPASTTALNVNYATRRAMSEGTDTLREYRGRGITKLIKSMSLRAAAERGITAAFTANNEVNAPMRAINAWLGYEFVGSTRTAHKTL